MQIENFTDIEIKNQFHKYDQVILDMSKDITTLKKIIKTMERKIESLSPNHVFTDKDAATEDFEYMN